MSVVETLHPDHVTYIDNRFQVSDIKNMDELPKCMQAEIKAAKTIRSAGFQELIGYYESNTIMWSAGGYWYDDRFVVINYGSNQYQWDGQRVTSTIREYV
jgi:hypothetical protein